MSKNLIFYKISFSSHHKFWLHNYFTISSIWNHKTFASQNQNLDHREFGTFGTFDAWSHAMVMDMMGVYQKHSVKLAHCSKIERILSIGKS